MQVAKTPLAEPPRDSRFGSPRQRSKVHWVRPEVAVEVTYLAWTEGKLMRQVCSTKGKARTSRQDKGCGRSASAENPR